MGSTVSIREARLGDIPELLRFAHELFSEGLPTIFTVDPLPNLRDEEAFVRPHLEKPGWLLLLAEVGGRVVGLLNFKRFEHAQTQHGGEFGISVLGRWRGHGIGSRLLDALAAWAPGRGICRLELQVFANNPAAIRLYRRHGFVEEGRRRGAVMVDGEPVDILLMAKQV